MSTPKKDSSGDFLIKLEGALSAYEVGKIKDQLLKEFENKDSITIDIEGITECDTLGIQLLCAAKKTAKQKNKKFSISGESERCSTAARNIGLNLETYLNS